MMSLKYSIKLTNGCQKFVAMTFQFMFLYFYLNCVLTSIKSALGNVLINTKKTLQHHSKSKALDILTSPIDIL